MPAMMHATVFILGRASRRFLSRKVSLLYLIYGEHIVQGNHVGVDAVMGHQAVVISVFHDSALAHDQDPLGMSCRGDTVSNGDAGPAGHNDGEF